MLMSLCFPKSRILVLLTNKMALSIDKRKNQMYLLVVGKVNVSISPYVLAFRF